MEKTSVKKALQKTSDGQQLTKADKKALSKLISVLRKAKKGKILSESNKKLIDQTIQKARTGTITPADFIHLAWHLFDIIKDST